jgi:hypothetical protein
MISCSSWGMFVVPRGTTLGEIDWHRYHFVGSPSRDANWLYETPATGVVDAMQSYDANYLHGTRS